MSKNDGGPAFPRPATPNTGALAQEGMSLRDYFAGQALMGILANGSQRDSLVNAASNFGIDGSDACAVAAYHHADAMLAEREKGDA